MKHKVHQNTNYTTCTCTYHCCTAVGLLHGREASPFTTLILNLLPHPTMGSSPVSLSHLQPGPLLRPHAGTADVLDHFFSLKISIQIILPQATLIHVFQSYLILRTLCWELEPSSLIGAGWGQKQSSLNTIISAQIFRPQRSLL